MPPLLLHIYIYIYSDHVPGLLGYFLYNQCEVCCTCSELLNPTPHRSVENQTPTERTICFLFLVADPLRNASLVERMLAAQHVEVVAMLELVLFFIFSSFFPLVTCKAVVVDELAWRVVSWVERGVTRQIQQVSVCSASDTRRRVSSLLSTLKRVLAAAS